MKAVNVAAIFALSLLVGCAQTSSRPEANSPDLSGDWTFAVQTGQNVVNGAMTLQSDGDHYRGTLTTDQGDNVLTVRSLTLDGADMTMLVESPQGQVTFKGALNADGRAFKGAVTYHNGQTFPMEGSRR